LIHINANTAKRVRLSILHAGQRCSASFGDLAVFSFDCPAIAGHRSDGAGHFFQFAVTSSQSSASAKTNPALTDRFVVTQTMQDFSAGHLVHVAL
jgi:hypothetical protein